MRRHVPVIAAIILLLPAPAAAGEPAAHDPELPATVGELIGRLRGAGQVIGRHTTNSGNESASAVLDRLSRLTDRLDALFGRALATPVGEVDDDLAGTVDQGIAALLLAERFATALRTCVRADMGVLLSAFAGNIRHTLGDKGSWSRSRPRILRVAADDVTSGYGLRAGVPLTLSVEGENLRSDDCGPVEGSISMNGDESIDVGARGPEEGIATLEVPALAEGGVYELAVRLRRRRFFLFCGSTTVRASVAVLPRAPLAFRYTISTTRAVVQRIDWNAGELKQSNDRCDADTIAARLFRLPDGWTYVSHRWTVFVNTGAVKLAEEVSDDGVRMQYDVARKGGAFCTGAPNMVHGVMEIVGTRTITKPGPSIEGRSTGGLAFGQSAIIPVDVKTESGSSIVEWTIDVRFVRPDGSEQALPSASGRGPLTGSRAGRGAFSWDPVERRLTVTAPVRTCGA